MRVEIAMPTLGYDMEPEGIGTWLHLPVARTRVLSLPDHLLIPHTPQFEDAVIPRVDSILEAARSAVG